MHRTRTMATYEAPTHNDHVPACKMCFCIFFDSNYYDLQVELPTLVESVHTAQSPTGHCYGNSMEQPTQWSCPLHVMCFFLSLALATMIHRSSFHVHLWHLYVAWSPTPYAGTVRVLFWLFHLLTAMITGRVFMCTQHGHLHPTQVLCITDSLSFILPTIDLPEHSYARHPV